MAFRTLLLLVLLAAASSFYAGHHGSVLVGRMRLASSSSSCDEVVPRSHLEVAVAESQSLRRVLTAGAAVAAVQTMFPASSFAYGDADDLARKKKPTKEKVVVQETDLGIPYLVSKKGSGPYPNPGDFVVISYTGLLSDGTVFDSTDAKGKKPLAFKMGEKQIIPGLESVIEMLQAGAEATCTIPAKYAYGEKGVCVKSGECLIKPNENLRYAIKVKTVGAGYN